MELSDVNVLFYLTNSKPFTQSGYTERTHQLLTSLKNEGINVRGVTRLGYPVVIGAFPLEEKTVVDGIEYSRLLPTKYPKLKSEQTDLAVEMLVREARDFSATILHTTTDFKNAIVVSRAAEILGIPWIYETRGELHKTWLSKRPDNLQSQAKHSEFYRAAERKELEAMENAAAVVQLSQVSKKQSIAQGIDENKIAVVPNAVSTRELGREYSKFDIRDELGLDKHWKIVGSVTSLVQYEGLDDLIRAVALLPEVHCLMVGDGEARPELEALTKHLELTDRVHFVGKKPSDTIWKWYAALDVFAVPRKDQEVCRTVTPIKTLLAQANGVPVVASDLPALREVTGDHAAYAPAENPKELANAIAQLFLAENQQLDNLREKARNWVSTRTWRANAQRLKTLYTQSSLNGG
ncbi:glycosyltransferase family 4 protein [Corynebacterium sp. L4756]